MDCFWSGFDSTFSWLMPGGDFNWTLAQYLDYGLLLSGSPFTVGIADIYTYMRYKIYIYIYIYKTR